MKKTYALVLSLLLLSHVLASQAVGSGRLAGGVPPAPARNAWELRFQFNFTKDLHGRREWNVVQDFLKEEIQKDSLTAVEYYGDEIQAQGPIRAHVYLEFTLPGNYGPYMMKQLEKRLADAGVQGGVYILSTGIARYSGLEKRSVGLDEHQAVKLLKALPTIQPIFDQRVLFDRVSCVRNPSTAFASCTVTSKEGIQTLKRDQSLLILAVLDELKIAKSNGAHVTQLVCDKQVGKEDCALDYFAN